MSTIQGIYKITNKFNGKLYIGQALDAWHRWWSHKTVLRKNQHINNYLQRAWNKYGEDTFEFVIIEEVLDASLLNIREQFWLDAFKAYNKAFGYNLAQYAASPGRGRIHSFEERQKMSKALKGKIRSKEHAHNLSLALTGRKHTAEFKKKMSLMRKGVNPWDKFKDPEAVRKKMSASLTGRKTWNKGKKGCYTLSDETKQKLSLAHKGKAHSAEWNHKVSLAKKGVPRSESTKHKISLANSGKRRSAAVKLKLSLAHMGISPWNKGRGILCTA